MALFGEAGAEAFVPLQHGRIPVKLGGNGGAQTYVFAPEITAMDGQDVRRVLVQERDTIMGIWQNGVASRRSMTQSVREATG